MESILDDETLVLALFCFCLPRYLVDLCLTQMITETYQQARICRAKLLRTEEEIVERDSRWGSKITLGLGPHLGADAAVYL